MAAGFHESIEKDLANRVDRLLSEMALDRQELKSPHQDREKMQKGLSHVAEVVDSLQRVRRMLKV